MRNHSLRLALLESDTIGRFRILGLRRVAKPTKGPGGLVTGSMSLSSAKVCELRRRDSSGNSTTLRVTGNHPFWSQDRQAWVPLNALRIGERLVQRSGVEACVESLRRLSGRWRVYNVEVEGAHCYFAGDWAVLVHNNDGTDVCFVSDPSKPQVEAVFEHNGKLSYDTDGKTNALSGDNYKLRSKGNLHAETGAMALSYESGERGGIGRLLVDTTNYSKDRICPNCLVDIKKMGVLLQLTELQITHISRKGVADYSFSAVDLLPIKQGGSSWKKS